MAFGGCGGWMMVRWTLKWAYKNLKLLLNVMIILLQPWPKPAIWLPDWCGTGDPGMGERPAGYVHRRETQTHHPVSFGLWGPGSRWVILQKLLTAMVHMPAGCVNSACIVTFGDRVIFVANLFLPVICSSHSSQCADFIKFMMQDFGVCVCAHVCVCVCMCVRVCVRVCVCMCVCVVSCMLRAWH